MPGGILFAHRVQDFSTRSGRGYADGASGRRASRADKDLGERVAVVTRAIIVVGAVTGAVAIDPPYSAPTFGLRGFALSVR